MLRRTLRFTLLAASSALALEHWSFDAGAQGWMVADLQTGGPYHPPLATYSVSHSSAGGCSGGHIFRSDPSNHSFAFALPMDQLPEGQDWSGGRLDFCLRCTHQNWTSEPFVLLAGANGDVLRSTIALPSATWSSYRVDLVPGAFRTMADQVPDAGSFQQVASNLEAIYIMAEYGAQVQETSGLDDVWLRPACAGDLGAPQVEAISSGTLEAPVVDLLWMAVPGAWSYDVWREQGDGWQLVGESQATQFTLVPATEETGIYRVVARCD